MALAGTDLFLANRGGVDYHVAYDAIKQDVLDAVPSYELEGNLIYKGTQPDEGSLPGDAEVGSIYSVGTTYWVQTPDGWQEMGQVEEVDLSDYALKSEIPTDNAQLLNGAGYITAGDLPEIPEAPVQSVDGKTGAVDLSKSYLPLDISSLPELPSS